jgi:hypothetical protein
MFWFDEEANAAWYEEERTGHGEGEWKVRQHGYTKRWTWRKLHLGVDECSGEVVATVLSTNNVGDSECLTCSFG